MIAWNLFHKTDRCYAPRFRAAVIMLVIAHNNHIVGKYPLLSPFIMVIMGMELAEEFVDNHNIEVRWDEVTCQNYGEIQEGGTFYQVWLEDEQSIEAKLNIMKKYNIAGVAAWKLGFEAQSSFPKIPLYRFPVPPHYPN